jgi:tRNA(fMet)-specific endonuclease VapC
VILLDTDHVSVLNRLGTAPAEDLMARVQAATGERVTITIISVVEQFRGWAAAINRAKDIAEEIRGYEGLSRFVELLRGLTVIPFDETAADVYASLRSRKLRIGRMDLKIASIALAKDALLLSANLRDFRKVPGLRVEDWLRP